MGAYTRFISQRRHGAGLWTHPTYNSSRRRVRGSGSLVQGVKKIGNKVRDFGLKVIKKSKGDVIKSVGKAGLKMVMGVSPAKAIGDLVKEEGKNAIKRTLQVANQEFGGGKKKKKRFVSKRRRARPFRPPLGHRY